MKKRIYIAVNGILNRPGSSESWTDEFTQWIHEFTEWRAEKFEYFAGPLTRRLFQNGRAKKLAKLISKFDNGEFEIVLVCHSNGCDLACRTLKMSTANVHSIHLISGACDADFMENGLNAALTSGRLQQVSVYVSDKDRAMWFASVTGKVLGIFGLGYGTLGLSGPTNVRQTVAEKITVKHFEEFGHSTIFESHNFNRLMRTICGLEEKTNE